MGGRIELILKVTQRCNFACEFCSSTEIAESDSQTLPHDYIFKFLKRFPNTSSLIINGGDGLLVPVEYYWKLIKHLDDNNYPANISFTTNLWDFYLHPDKWTNLFKHPRIGVGTSFQYGTKRKITKKLVYTENIFLKVINLFKTRIGYTPEFIAVIDEENEDTVIKTVELAKSLGVVCKINYAMASGRQENNYQLSKMYYKYLEIYKKGLAPWEFNTQQMFKSHNNGHTLCPLSRDCDSHIRALNPDGTYFSCGSFADDKKFAIEFEKEMSGEMAHPLSTNSELVSLKTECLICPMFKICNGCRKSMYDLIKAKKVEEHCTRMKEIAITLIPLLEIRNAEDNNTFAPSYT